MFAGRQTGDELYRFAGAPQDLGGVRRTGDLFDHGPAITRAIAAPVHHQFHFAILRRAIHREVLLAPAQFAFVNGHPIVTTYQPADRWYVLTGAPGDRGGHGVAGDVRNGGPAIAFHFTIMVQGEIDRAIVAGAGHIDVFLVPAILLVGHHYPIFTGAQAVDRIGGLTGAPEHIGGTHRAGDIAYRRPALSLTFTSMVHGEVDLAAYRTGDREVLLVPAAVRVGHHHPMFAIGKARNELNGLARTP